MFNIDFVFSVCLWQLVNVILIFYFQFLQNKLFSTSLNDYKGRFIQLSLKYYIYVTYYSILVIIKHKESHWFLIFNKKKKKKTALRK